MNTSNSYSSHFPNTANQSSSDSTPQASSAPNGASQPTVSQPASPFTKLGDWRNRGRRLPGRLGRGAPPHSPSDSETEAGPDELTDKLGGGEMLDNTNKSCATRQRDGIDTDHPAFVGYADSGESILAFTEMSKTARQYVVCRRPKAFELLPESECGGSAVWRLLNQMPVEKVLPRIGVGHHLTPDRPERQRPILDLLLYNRHTVL